jgi:Arc/MetJ-type ribon-helix-helix transcriptional regulator
MAGARVHVVMPQELVERIDEARASGESRGEFVRRAVERALSEAQGLPTGIQADPGPVSSLEDVRSAAPAEQPQKPPDLPRASSLVRDHPATRQHLPTCKCPMCK